MGKKRSRGATLLSFLSNCLLPFYCHYYSLQQSFVSIDDRLRRPCRLVLCTSQEIIRVTFFHKQTSYHLYEGSIQRDEKWVSSHFLFVQAFSFIDLSLLRISYSYVLESIADSHWDFHVALHCCFWFFLGLLRLLVFTFVTFLAFLRNVGLTQTYMSLYFLIQHRAFFPSKATPFSKHKDPQHRESWEYPVSRGLRDSHHQDLQERCQ